MKQILLLAIALSFVLVACSSPANVGPVTTRTPTAGQPGASDPNGTDEADTGSTQIPQSPGAAALSVGVPATVSQGSEAIIQEAVYFRPEFEEFKDSDAFNLAAVSLLGLPLTRGFDEIVLFKPQSDCDVPPTVSAVSDGGGVTVQIVAYSAPPDSDCEAIEQGAAIGLIWVEGFVPESFDAWYQPGRLGPPLSGPIGLSPSQ